MTGFYMKRNTGLKWGNVLFVTEFTTPFDIFSSTNVMDLLEK